MVLASPQCDRAQLIAWAEFIESIRGFFRARDVLAVSTPLVSTYTTPDPHIHSVACQWTDGVGYLHTSPEYAMKRLLAAGSGSIYQICSAFRDDAASPLHRLEFTMLEWYRVGYDYHVLMAEVSDLIMAILPIKQVDRICYQALFEQFLGVDIDSADVEALHLILADALTHSMTCRDKNAYLDALMSLVIQPQLADYPALLVYDYPREQAALARLSTHNPAYAERFELFMGGVEVANGFSELTDAQEQEQRFIAENAQRVHMGLAPMPMDTDFLAALASGLPDCAGVAVGLDRLFMRLQGRDHI